jgi:hypothetical protein
LYARDSKLFANNSKKVTIMRRIIHWDCNRDITTQATGFGMLPVQVETVMMRSLYNAIPPLFRSDALIVVGTQWTPFDATDRTANDLRGMIFKLKYNLSVWQRSPAVSAQSKPLDHHSVFFERCGKFNCIRTAFDPCRDRADILLAATNAGRSTAWLNQ